MSFSAFERHVASNRLFAIEYTEYFFAGVPWTLADPQNPEVCDRTCVTWVDDNGVEHSDYFYYCDPASISSYAATLLPSESQTLLLQRFACNIHCFWSYVLHRLTDSTVPEELAVVASTFAREDVVLRKPGEGNIPRLPGVPSEIYHPNPPASMPDPVHDKDSCSTPAEEPGKQQVGTPEDTPHSNEGHGPASAATAPVANSRLTPPQLKEEANEYYKGGDSHMARALYTAALEDCEDPDLEATLYLNRAACNLKLGFHWEATGDSDRVLNLIPGHGKALYRRAVAKQALGKHRAALRDAIASERVAPNPEVSRLVLRLQTELASSWTAHVFHLNILCNAALLLITSLFVCTVDFVDPSPTLAAALICVYAASVYKLLRVLLKAANQSATKCTSQQDKER